MAITRGATVTTFLTSSIVTAVADSHTVDTGTTLLILVISQQANETIDVAPFWNTDEAFTLIHTSAGLDGTDMTNHTYGLVSPTAATADITYTVSSQAHLSHTAVNYLGTISSTVADATNYLNEDINNSGTDTTVLASGGSTGETLLAAAVFRGGDGDTASNATGFTELADSATGTSTTSDHSFYVADLIGGAAAAITITWAATDENTGQLIEILEAGAAGNPWYYYAQLALLFCLTPIITMFSYIKNYSKRLNYA